MILETGRHRQEPWRLGTMERTVGAPSSCTAKKPAAAGEDQSDAMRRVWPGRLRAGEFDGGVES